LLDTAGALSSPGPRPPSLERLSGGASINAIFTTPHSYHRRSVRYLIGTGLGRFQRRYFRPDGKKKSKAKIAAVEKLAASGHPRAVAVLRAFLEGRLYIQKKGGKPAIVKKSGRDFETFDPESGDPLGVAPKKSLKKVRINNRLRKVVKGALGGLTLLSPYREKRAEAAKAVFKDRQAAMLPMLEKALAKETDTTARNEMTRALAAIQATRLKDTERRVAALEVLATYTDQDVRALVAGLLTTDAQGKPLESDQKVREAAGNALKVIEDRLQLWGFAASIFQGVSLGSVLLLAAMGLAITFGAMGVINMAHGEMVMLGAYTTFVVQSLFHAYAPDLFNWSMVVAIPAAFLVAAAVGIAIERGVIRFLYGRPLETLLATWGISLILQQAVRTIFGPTNREVANPSWMSGAVELVGGLTLTYNRIWIIVFSLLVLALIMILMRRTEFGLQMRAVTQNRAMAASMGIRTGRVDALTFGLGSGIAGMAGVALSQIDNVSPNLGQAYIIDIFMVVVFGGVGNLWGTLVGAMGLGIVNKFLEPVSGAVLAKILVLIAIILFIQRRPRGLFALRGCAVEA